MRTVRKTLLAACALAVVVLLVHPDAMAGLFGRNKDAAPEGEAGTLKPSEVKKLRKSAREMLEGGRADEALAAYRRLLDSQPQGSDAHAEAVYGAALVYLAGNGAAPERDAVLAEMPSLRSAPPGFGQRPEVEALLGMAGAVERERETALALRAEVDRLQAEIESARTEHAAEEEQRQTGEECQKTLDKRTAEARQLRSKVKSLEEQLAESQAQLEKEREALKKVTETLMGGSGR